MPKKPSGACSPTSRPYTSPMRTPASMMLACAVSSDDNCKNITIWSVAIRDIHGQRWSVTVPKQISEQIVSGTPQASGLDLPATVCRSFRLPRLSDHCTFAQQKQRRFQNAVVLVGRQRWQQSAWPGTGARLACPLSETSAQTSRLLAKPAVSPRQVKLLSTLLCLQK